jgi:hypothetical protein
MEIECVCIYICVCVYIYIMRLYIYIYVCVCLYKGLYRYFIGKKSDSWDLLGRSYDKDEMTHKQDS